MSEFLTNIGAIFQSLINWLQEISSYLITNPIFIIVVAIGIFSVLIYSLIGMIKNKREYKSWKENYSQNAIDMEEEEYNHIEDYGRW